MSTYRAFVMKEVNGSITNDIVLENTENLTYGNVLVKVIYSNINSYDVLYTDHTSKIHSYSYPYIPGVDAAGIVIESKSDFFRKGDEVIIFGGGLGTIYAGGFGQYVRVADTNIFNLPTGITLKDSMTIGSDGIAAAIACMEIMSLKDYENKKVVVTGAAMGIGAYATALLNQCGFEVEAVTTYPDAESFIKEMGAKSVVSLDKFVNNSQEGMLPEKYIAGVDTIGGDVSSTIIRSLFRNGIVTQCGASKYKNLNLSLLPFIMRSINLIGVDALGCSHGLKQEALYKLAGDWYIKQLPFLCNEISIFEISEYLEKMRSTMVRGRIVINHDI